jgi:RNA polymerase primary sigma factor
LKVWLDIEDQLKYDSLNLLKKDPYLHLPSFKPITILDRESERKLLIRASKGDLEARNFLIENNQFLVLKIANLYRHAAGMGFDFEDMIQEGNVGLIRAVDKFKVRNQVRLSTYATYWIHQRIGRGLMEKGRLVHLPVNLQYSFYRAVKKLNDNPNAKISKKEIHSFRGFGHGGDINKDSELSHYPTSIEDTNLHHVLKMRNVDLEKRISLMDTEKYLNRTKGITDLQKEVIKLHIGLDGNSKDFVEIGKILGKRPSTVRSLFDRGVFLIRNEIQGAREIFKEDLCI